MSPATPLDLSVLIASHNRRELLQRCLRILEEQTQDPGSFEVIVADDGSTDGTTEMVEGLQTSYGLRALKLEKAGKPLALNAAIEAARGRVCLFIDDDVVASPELIEEHVAANERDPQTLGIGALTQVAPKRSDPYAEAYARRWNERYEGLAGRATDWADCYGANFSAPREALLEIGGFATDIDAVEDLEVAYRLSQVGCVAHYLPRASAVHDDDKPSRRILADEERFGSFCVDFVAARPETSRRLFGWVNEPSLREVALRRALLVLRLRPRWLVAAGRLLPSQQRDVWFGFVSRYAFWHGARTAMSRERWLQTTRGVPVLMYHAFTDSREKDRFVLSKRSFARQMRLLALLRYRVITLDQLALALRDQEPLPRRAAVVTIDDGYRDTLEIAVPILRRHRFPATVFLVSQRIGASNSWDSEGAVSERPLLSLEQIEQMRADGVGIGAHTRTHCRLPSETDEGVREQIAGSREDLETALGESVETLTYPFGLYDERAIRVAADAGFLAACTTSAQPSRPGDDPLAIPRIEIAGPDSIVRFLRKLTLGGN